MNEKTEEKWTEEERKAAAEYKTQLKTQEEEREKYKKVSAFYRLLMSCFVEKNLISIILKIFE